MKKGMYFKNIFHKFGKISIFMKLISLARATVFLKAFQNTERPRWTERHAAMFVGGC